MESPQVLGIVGPEWRQRCYSCCRLGFRCSRGRSCSRSGSCSCCWSFQIKPTRLQSGLQILDFALFLCNDALKVFDDLVILRLPVDSIVPWPSDLVRLFLQPRAYRRSVLEGCDLGLLLRLACVECLLQGAVEGSLQQGVASLHSKLLKLVFLRLLVGLPFFQSLLQAAVDGGTQQCVTSLDSQVFDLVLILRGLQRGRQRPITCSLQKCGSCLLPQLLELRSVLSGPGFAQRHIQASITRRVDERSCGLFAQASNICCRVSRENRC
mmetsp:Transcript_31091/g.74165  ORF Transcript_31091/g.74165 Transcript_31091/m.74165 type:complete len:267 (-) Transcript_31091:761-1561(-)